MRLCVMIVFLCVLLLLSEVSTSVFQNAEVPKVGISDLGNKGIFLCSLYIKAREFQCSSVYYWSSLEEDLLLFAQ